ncbi:MAG: hypothetical protein GXP55_16140 [Deltaproteobacteria bacterium]|nr:hypothetical protein [Deltaproteobacteria bacterium]
MKRVLQSVLFSSLIALVFTLSNVTTMADAQRRRRRHPRRQAAPTEAPRSDAIAPALGDIRWGMTKDEVLRYFTKQVHEEFHPRLTKAPGAIEEDQIRHEMTEKIRRIRDSYIRFGGQTTGYDSGFLREEFTHNNGESMLRVQTAQSDDYYFFIRGRLWKWYRAFNSSVFGGASFDQFAAALQGRFGPAWERNQPTHEGGERVHWLEWQDDDTHLRAIDNNSFYGFYCLVFESKETLGRLAQLRTNQSRRTNTHHSLVDAVTSGEGEPANPDTNPDIIDRITGHIRHRQDAPEEDGDNRQERRRSGDSVGNDPLRGL